MQGVTPIEMFGRTPFPAVGPGPYTVTLNPFAFYWFLLPMPTAASRRDTREFKAPAVAFSGSLEELALGDERELLEGVLPSYLRESRWFRGKTRQITSAMKLVAAAKLRRATERALSARPYQKKLGEVMGSVAARAEGFESPLMTKREQVKTIHVTLVTTDRGLCGPFNGTLLRHAYEWFQERKQPGVEVKIRVYGRRGRDFPSLGSRAPEAGVPGGATHG